MLAILFQLVIAAIICGAILYLVRLVPGAAPFANVIQVIVIVIFVIWALYLLYGLLSGGHPPAIAR